MVVSRVGDEGISLPEIERVIEISWLHGSRRQELQRFTRLLHGKGSQGEGHIIMTVDEYQRDRKRLFGIMDKGFKIILHREGISEKTIQRIREKPQVLKKWMKPKELEKKKPDEFIDFSKSHPILSLPGIQKKLDQLNPSEKKCVTLLFQREGEGFTRDGLAMLLGFSTADSMRHAIDFKKLQLMKLVTTDKGEMKADLSLMRLAKNER